MARGAWRTMKAAFPVTIPVLTGYLFLGTAFGVLLASKGYGAGWALLMSVTVYAGSMQFVAAGLLAGGFHPLTAALVTLLVNARHIFYGLSMLDTYRGMGREKPYMVFALTDETFALLRTAKPPRGIPVRGFRLAIAAMNHGYWVLGSVLGGLLGAAFPFDTRGIEFVMTALFVVIFLTQWARTEGRPAALLGLGVTAACLALLGRDWFLPATMGMLTVLLLSLRRPLEGGEGK